MRVFRNRICNRCAIAVPGPTTSHAKPMNLQRFFPGDDLSPSAWDGVGSGSIHPIRLGGGGFAPLLGGAVPRRAPSLEWLCADPGAVSR